jgi:tetratricopeptide (TPR) repeat protein
MALAWESEDEADILAVSALRTWPHCCEAYLLLAMEASEEVELALMLFTLAVFAGAEALGPTKMEQYAGRFSEHEEALPFLQALAGLARVNLAAGAVEAAAMHLGEVIRLDTSDLLGARYELLTILLATGDYANAEALIEAYNEPSAPMVYGSALLAFAREGDSPAAVERLQAARTTNPHVWPYLAGERQLTASGPLDFEFGSEEEALSFAPLILGAWQGVPGALEWVKGLPGAASPAPVKPPEKARRSGPREI